MYMVLTDTEILKLVKTQTPLIENFKEESLQSESYDLSIGSFYSKYLDDFMILDLENQEKINSIYRTERIPIGGLLIGPRDYVLLSVDERINMPSNLTAHIRPRTKFTRLGLLMSSQHCNSSYSGNLNLGLFNVNPFAVIIHPGMKIAQIVFEQLTDIPTKEYGGKYQHENGTKGADLSSEFQTDKDTLKKLNGDQVAIEKYNKLVRGLK